MADSNKGMNDFIRQAASKTPAPVATEAPQAPRTPVGNAGNGAGQTGPFQPKQNFNVWLRQSGRGNKF